MFRIIDVAPFDSASAVMRNGTRPVKRKQVLELAQAFDARPEDPDIDGAVDRQDQQWAQPDPAAADDRTGVSRSELVPRNAHKEPAMAECKRGRARRTAPRVRLDVGVHHVTAARLDGLAGRPPADEQARRALILLICDDDPRLHANTTVDHIAAFSRYSPTASTG